MPVTTTYSLNFVSNIDLDFATAASDITSLANGGYSALGNHLTHIDGNIFNSSAVETDGYTSVTGTNGAIDQLANGNLVIVGQDADSTLYTILDSVTGATVVASTDLADVDQTNADVAALTGGRFVIVAMDEIGAVGGDSDIDVFIRNADGTAATSFSVDISAARDIDPSIAALDNGNFVVAWTRDVAGDTEVWRAVYTPTGAAVAAPAIVDTFGTINRNVSVSATNLGFAIAYEDNGWAGVGNTDITLARHNSDGSFIGFTNVNNPTLIADGSGDANPYVTRLANGFLVVGYGDNTFGDTDTIVSLRDTTGATQLTSRNISGGQSISDDVDFISLAGFGLGRIAAYHTNLTDTDIVGEALQGRRTSTSDAAADTINGDDFIDIMFGNDGNDTLSGAANNDTLNGGNGDDALDGGSEVDSLDGGDGNDTLDGGADADTLNGGAGNDSIIGAGGIDTLTYFNASGGVTVDLRIAAAQATGGSGTDTIATVENLVGSAFSDTLLGTDAVNILDGFSGVDRLEGFLGDDVYFLRDIGTTLVDTGGFDRINLVLPAATSYTLPTGFEILDFSSSAALIIGNGNSVDNLIFANGINSELHGHDGNDQLFGNIGNNRLEGGNGIDLLYGSDGDDALLGQIGVDRLEGEAGNDVLFAGEGDDSVIGGSGTDNAFGENGNDLMFGGTGNDTMQGEFGDDRLFGEQDNDDLFGGVGNDELQGEQGDDRLFGDVGTDTMFGQDGADLLLGEGDNDRLFGGFGADLMFGQAGNDELQGEQDNDRLFGGFGADSMFGQDGNDEMQGEQDNDRMWGGNGTDSMFGQDGTDEIYGEADNDRMWGGAGGDSLYGGAGADEMHGEADGDILFGGFGNDTLNGGGGADLFQFSTGGNADQVNDFQDAFDLLDARSVVGATFANTTIAPSGGNTLVTFVSGETALLIGIASVNVTALDFLFI